MKVISARNLPENLYIYIYICMTQFLKIMKQVEQSWPPVRPHNCLKAIHSEITLHCRQEDKCSPLQNSSDRTRLEHENTANVTTCARGYPKAWMQMAAACTAAEASTPLAYAKPVHRKPSHRCISLRYQSEGSQEPQKRSSPGSKPSVDLIGVCSGVVFAALVRCASPLH